MYKCVSHLLLTETPSFSSVLMNQTYFPQKLWQKCRYSTTENGQYLNSLSKYEVNSVRHFGMC